MLTLTPFKPILNNLPHFPPPSAASTTTIDRIPQLMLKFDRLNHILTLSLARQMNSKNGWMEEMRDGVDLMRRGHGLPLILSLGGKAYKPDEWNCARTCTITEGWYRLVLANCLSSRSAYTPCLH